MVQTVSDVLGKEITDVEAAKRAEQMIHSVRSEPVDPSACDHESVVALETGYACAYCHADVSLSDADEVWVTLKNGLMKIKVCRGLGELFG